MPYIKVGQENSSDIEIFYKDCGKGQPIVFSHGWPLSAYDWNAQMLQQARQRRALRGLGISATFL